MRKLLATIVLIVFMSTTSLAASLEQETKHNLDKFIIEPGRSYQISFKYHNDSEFTSEKSVLFIYDMSDDYAEVDPHSLTKVGPLNWVLGPVAEIGPAQSGTIEIITYTLEIPESIEKGIYRLAMVMRTGEKIDRIPITLIYGSESESPIVNVEDIKGGTGSSVTVSIRNQGSDVEGFTLKYDLKDSLTWEVIGSGEFNVRRNVPSGRTTEVEFVPQVPGVPSGEYLLTVYVDDYGIDFPSYNHIEPIMKSVVDTVEMDQVPATEVTHYTFLFGLLTGLIGGVLGCLVIMKLSRRSKKKPLMQ